MIQITSQTAGALARQHFARVVADAVENARPDLQWNRDDFYAVVEGHYEIGKTAGFLTEADLGLYCIACYFDPEGMDPEGLNNERGYRARSTFDPIDARRFALKSELDAAGHLPFGSHEAIPKETEAP